MPEFQTRIFALSSSNTKMLLSKQAGTLNSEVPAVRAEGCKIPATRIYLQNKHLKRKFQNALVNVKEGIKKNGNKKMIMVMINK